MSQEQPKRPKGGFLTSALENSPTVPTPPNLVRGQGIQLSTQNKETANQQKHDTIDPLNSNTAVSQTSSNTELQNSNTATRQDSNTVESQESSKTRLQDGNVAKIRKQKSAKLQKRSTTKKRDSKTDELQSSGTAGSQDGRINRGVTMYEALFDVYKFSGTVLKVPYSAILEEAALDFLPELKAKMRTNKNVSPIMYTAFVEMLKQYGLE